MQGSSLPETVLVTGGAGFIGSSLVRALLAARRKVVVIDDYSSGHPERLPRHAPEGAQLMSVRGDVTEAGVLEEWIGRERPSCVVHLAARVGVRRVLADPEACRDENVLGVRRLVDALAKLPAAGRPRVIAASTSEVYREKDTLLEEGDPLRPLDGRGRWAYAASKRRAEEELDRSGVVAGGALHLRFFNVVGPGQDADQGMVLPTFVEQALRGAPLTVHGDGNQVRTLAHVDDVASDIATPVLRRECPTGAWNMGGNARCTMTELAQSVIRAAGSASAILRVDPLEAVSRRFEEVRHREPNLARARALGLARAPRDLEAIVADTVARHGAARMSTDVPSDGPVAGERERVPCASPAS